MGKTIYFVFAEGCDACERMRKTIEGCRSGDCVFSLTSYSSEQDSAVDFAVENGITDLPSCKIGDRIIEGENFDGAELARTIKEYCQ